LAGKVGKRRQNVRKYAGGVKEMNAQQLRLLVLLLLAILLAFISSLFPQLSDLTDSQFPKLLPQWTQ
jgi:hypothetical protein